MNQPSAPARVIALAATWTVLAVHLDLVNDHLREAPYVGALFILGVGLLVPVVHGLASRAHFERALAFGALVQAGMLAAVVLSRTVGLPGLQRETWADDYGLGAVAAVAECCYLAVVLVLRRPSGLRAPMLQAGRAPSASSPAPR